MKQERSLPLVILCYAAIYTVWSSTYLFIALAVKTIPPGWVVAGRFLSAGLAFTLIPVLTGQVKTLPTKKEVFSSLFLGFFLLIMGNGVVTIAEQSVDSYLTALLIATIPLVVAFFNRLLFKTRMTWNQLAGILAGIAGISLLLYTGDVRPPEEIKGIALLFLAVTCWGFGTSYSKKLHPHGNIFFHTGMQMLFAGTVALITVFLSEEQPLQTWETASALSLYSLLFLAVVGSLAIAAYNYLLKVEPTTRITSYTLVNPLLATVLGIVVNHEQPTPLLPFGVPLILTGLVLMLYINPAIKKPGASRTPG